MSFSSPSETDTQATQEQKLIDYSDTHVLDFEPNLKRLSTLAVIENNIDPSMLPYAIQCVFISICFRFRLSRSIDLWMVPGPFN